MIDYENVYSMEQYAEEFSGSSVEELRQEWANMTEEQILNACNDIWPDDDNTYLAHCIYHVVSQ